MTKTGDRTYVRDPTKDVGMKAHVVLGNVESPLNENISLQCTTIICSSIVRL